MQKPPVNIIIAGNVNQPRGNKMASLNKIMIIGNATRDAETRTMPTGTTVANFTVAVNESYKDKSGEKVEKTEFIKCVAWGKLAEICGQYLKTGRQIYVEGKLQTRKWQDNDGCDKYMTEINANVVQFLGKNSDQAVTDDLPF